MSQTKPSFKNVFLMAALLVSSAAMANIKIGVVDLQKALQEVKAGKTAKASLEKEFQTKKGVLDKEQEEIRKLSEDFQKKSMALSQEARAQRGMELQKRMGQWQESVQKSQVDIQKREASLTKPILDGLRELIPELSKDKKVDLVLEVNTGGLLYAVERVDLTDELIKKFDSKKK